MKELVPHYTVNTMKIENIYLIDPRCNADLISLEGQNMSLFNSAFGCGRKVSRCVHVDAALSKLLFL